MSKKNRGESLEEHDRALRIAELKQQAEERAGGKMVSWESSMLSGQQREEFWRRVLECDDDGPTTTDFEELTKAGLELPEPEAMNDEQLTAKLWEVIHGLARMQVFLSSTDHLSDRELYALLWRDVLRQETKAPTRCPGAFCHVNLVSNGSEEDTLLYLKYYADEDSRRFWLTEFPDDRVPAHEDPPYDRDRHLPQPDYEAAIGH